MSEQITTPAIEPTIPAIPTVPAPVQTPIHAVQTPSTAVNVDINSIISQAEAKAGEAAEKKMEAVFKSMLQQQGFDAGAINNMTAEWKAKQVTPEQIIKNKDDEIQQRDGTIGRLQQQIEIERQEKIALAKGVPLGAEDEATKEKAAACITLAKSYISDAVTFEAAIDKAIGMMFPKEVKPAAPPKPQIVPGTPAAPVTATETEQLKNQYEDAKKKKQWSVVSALTRLAKEKNIKLEE